MFGPQGFIGVTSPARFITFFTMFSSSLRASLVALIASGVAVSAAPALILGINLSVILSLGSKSNGPENMNVVTTVANTGSKSVKLLKDPRGVLNSFPENSFTITGPTGSQPSFNGARVSLASSYVTKLRADAFGLPF